MMKVNKMREEFEQWAYRFHREQGDWFKSDDKMLAQYENGEYVV